MVAYLERGRNMNQMQVSPNSDLRGSTQGYTNCCGTNVDDWTNTYHNEDLMMKAVSCDRYWGHWDKSSYPTGLEMHNSEPSDRITWLSRDSLPSLADFILVW
jgi:hypothetical protein